MGWRTIRRAFSWQSLLMLGLATWCAPSCTSGLSPGAFGPIRILGQVKGAPPLRLSPPFSDVAGNIYTLFGSLDTAEAIPFVSHVGGGSEAVACQGSTKGDKFGVHGWVGFAQERAWYWSGEGLVGIQPSTQGTSCGLVLNTDRATNASLAFRAVLPWVRDSPSRTTLVALVQSPVDNAPFAVMVDLNTEILINIQPFEPRDATEVSILGVGADRETNVGVVLLQYTSNGRKTEARFYDADANLTARVPLTVDQVSEYGVRGYLEMHSSGRFFGLLEDKTLVAVDRSSGAILHPSGPLDPVGVHRWEDKVYVVGAANGRPAIAELDASGVPRAAVEWTASTAAMATLSSALNVSDDRSRPTRSAVWTSAKTAMGDFPFVSPHSLTRHAAGTTLWLIAGPMVTTGGASQTLVAVAPVGVSYP